MTCSEFLKELTDYLDESMDAQTRAELEDHLQWCHNCYVVCNTTKRTIEIYRDSHLYELPEDLRSRLRSAILTKCHSPQATESGAKPSAELEPKLSTSPNDNPTK
ncbi:MAG TPA: zf-HC2 domain-containing protein [Terriglobales bacterium]|nr:zf-HC2 domain-containing protein [Terriglobales bacterium]